VFRPLESRDKISDETFTLVKVAPTLKVMEELVSLNQSQFCGRRRRLEMPDIIEWGTDESVI